VELRDLEAFVAVADELHFGRAAMRLYVAQPSLSNRISQLERELRLQLFDRSTRSVTLTDAGQRLLTPARHVLKHATAMRDTADLIVAGGEGLVRVGFLGVGSARALSLLANAVRSTHPGIELLLRSEVHVDKAFDLLLDGDLDIAFVRAPITPPELSFRVVEVEDLLLAMPEGHRMAGQDSVRLIDLKEDGFVSMAQNTRSMLRATLYSMCVSVGFSPHIVQVAPDPGTVMALVAAGAGVTITLSSVRQVQNVGIVYKPIADIVPNYMIAALAWRTDNASPALARIREVSEEALPSPDLSKFGITESELRVGL
jgi:DNA-binding transcriptional LysR family regulator